METSVRIYKLDNIKSILIFLVVFGHLCEQIHFRYSSFLYLLIYSFHMPAFAFTSGYCYKKKPLEVIIKKYLCPYFIFQVLYIAFAKYILHADISFQFTTPYWILWYLLSLFFWNLIMSASGESDKAARKIFLMSIPFALLTGFDTTVGYYLSLSRTIVMFPFFSGGYYFMKKGYLNKINCNKLSKRIQILSFFGTLFTIIVLYIGRGKLNVSWAYHSMPYQPEQCNIYLRFFFLFTAAVFVCFFFVFIPNKKYPIITRIGQETLGIFLIHGFIIRYLTYKNILQTIPYRTFSIFFLTIVILFALSNKKIDMILRNLFIKKH